MPAYALTTRAIRTAYARISGETVFVVLLRMLHLARELEPLANPVRFNICFHEYLSRLQNGRAGNYVESNQRVLDVIADGKSMTALVTGAGRRIGRAIALHLAQRGHNVVVHYSASKADAEDTVAAIRNLGGTAESIRADFMDETETSSLVRRSCEMFGPLSVLVNNASIFEEDTILTATQESWDRHMRSNLRAPFVLTQCFAQQVCSPPGVASIINMVDQRVHKLTPQFMTYTLAKSALWTLTQTAAQALAPDIRVNAIGPGPTLQGARQSSEDFRAQCSATLLRRGGSPEDVTTAVSYLLDARSVTGQIICPDSGQHLAWETADAIGVE